MLNNVIFKTLRTYRHPYVYDRHTNTLAVLSEDEYQELRQVERGDLFAEQSSVVKKYQEHGLFTPNAVEKIEHPGSMLIEHYLNSRMKQLTLQVTQECNLRCDYCVYSGNYRQSRTHTNIRMNLDTAKHAIDFFLERNNELSEVVIGFYGGEPLLEFGLIIQCVEYANSKVEGKRIRYNITTNGTLLTDDVVDFLVKHDFILNISLDGSKEEHDRSRKFPNGYGSFDIIIKNIRRLQARFPEYEKKVTISAVINPHADLSCVMEFFTTDEIFSDRNIIFSDVNTKGYTGEFNYDQNFYLIRNYEYIKMLLALVGKLDNKYISPLFHRTTNSIKQKQRGIISHMPLSPKAHHGGPCFPGVKRLFVRFDGALFPCERVSDMLDYFVIGTLENGLDVDKILNILNIGQITEDECKNCWGMRHCMLCAGQIEFENSPTKGDKIRECSSRLSRGYSELYELCVLNEFCFDAQRDL